MKWLSLLAASITLVHAADPFAENVRTTEPLPPAEQAKTFKLPPGFQIQLVTSEPHIYKPMNMAFDTKGRLWVSTSREYPYPVPLDKKGRDSIKIFEDFDATGRARKVTTFVDGLNLPIGLYPYKNGVIAWSIPNIWYFQDTDDDGKADQRQVLFGPLGWERDTHGNQASFRRGFDGWLYATHGFNNNSTFHATDGSELSLNSGNTYRVRLDGSRVEPHTWGQVNPFGLCFDPAGNMYSADCHSAPIYELLRGGYYPSFGKPHDGLGFAPTMLEHSHGSTAICGIIFYADNLWPEEFQNNILIGNVMTSRINRDTLLPRGSSKTAREEADFLTTTDPWFRPVDLQLGPDGALYVADFYNRIIGHYEVPLNHPGRDRERGRIWKISYTGKPLHGLPDFSGASVADLIDEFRGPSLSRRMLALNEIVDRHGNAAIDALQATLSKSESVPNEIVHSLWALHRLHALDAKMLAPFSQGGDPLVRNHVMRVLSEEPAFASLRETAAVRALEDSDPGVRRSAADALARFPDAQKYVEPLLASLRRTPREDDHLRHAIRMALRNQLTNGGPSLAYTNYDARDAQVIADICLAIPHSDAANFLLEHIRSAKERLPRISEYTRHAARHIAEPGVAQLASYIRETFRSNIDEQLSFFRAIQEGSAQRGRALSKDLREWGSDLAANLLASADSENQTWRNYPIAGKPVATNPWFLQKRPSSDGDRDSLFLCSLPPGGEHFTGVLRSRPFTIPARLKFFVAGHDGIPTAPPQGNNLVRLISAEGGTVLRQAAAPRNDTAQPVEWDLSEHQGRRAVLELVDADTGSGYAWIAAGRFEPAVAPLPAINPNQISARIEAAADLAKQLELASLAPQMGELLASEAVDLEAQGALAGALVALEPNETRLALAPLAGDPVIPAGLRQKIGRALAAGRKGNAHEVLVEAMRIAPARVQQRLAQSLAGSAAGAETLFDLVEKRQAAAQVLLEPSVQDKLAALNSDPLKSRLAALTRNLEPRSEAIQKQIEGFRASFKPREASAVDGGQVFLKNCAVCHQLDGSGAIIGPQLDGIGARGLERLLEDIIDPNRNVDVSFRTEIFTLKDDELLTGQFRREEGETIVIADATGKEIAIPKSQIESRRQSETSLMPSNFADILPRREFQDLIAFLLSKGVPTGTR